MCDVCGKRVEKYWVVFKNGTKCCDYMCSVKHPFDIREVVNIEDFSEPRPVLPKKKGEVNFTFKSEEELLQLNDDELLNYYEEFDYFRRYQPDKFSNDYDNYKEDQYIKEMENEYYLSTSDEEDGLFVSENNIY